MAAQTGTAATGVASGQTSLTVSLTIPVGATRVVAAEGGFESTQRDCTGVTLDGGAMTQVGSNQYNGGRHASCWEMRDSDANWPGDDVTVDVVFTVATARSIRGAAQSFTDTADSAAGTPVTDDSGASGVSNTPSVTVSSAAGDIVFGIITSYSAARNTDAADDEIFWSDGSTGDASVYIFTNDGAASVDFDAQYGAPTTVNYVMMAFNIPDAGGGGGGTVANQLQAENLGKGLINQGQIS